MDPAIRKQVEHLTRGCVDVVTRDELTDRLADAAAHGRPLTVKSGFDPTAPDLHLGHTVLLRKMRHFQDLGHRVVFLIGDFTGLIGDPSGRSVTRKVMTRDEVLQNARTYERQVFRILDPETTRIDFNSRWLGALDTEALIRICAHFTVARILEREDFSTRMGKNLPLHLHELLYPVMQAYDSVALQADVELGGHDQLLNLLFGRDLQRAMGFSPQLVLTVPLLEGLDGIEKMSKSLGNTIGIEEEPDAMFGKIMSISDELMWRYYELLTDIPMEEVGAMRESARLGKANPRDAKLRLAGLIVGQYHGIKAARRAETAFMEVFSRRRLPQDLSEVHRTVRARPVPMVNLLVEEGLASSRREARRLIRNGAVSWVRVQTGSGVEFINQLSRVTDLGFTVDARQPCRILLKVGKRRFKAIEFERPTVSETGHVAESSEIPEPRRNG